MVLYAMLTTCAFYLGSEAEITKFLWSRYPGSSYQNLLGYDVGFSAFMRCPACVGFWWGVLLGLFGAYHRVPFMGLPGRWWVTVLFTGLSSVVWTPLLAHLHRKALGG